MARRRTIMGTLIILTMVFLLLAIGYVSLDSTSRGEMSWAAILLEGIKVLSTKVWEFICNVCYFTRDYTVMLYQSGELWYVLKWIIGIIIITIVVELLFGGIISIIKKFLYGWAGQVCQ